MNISANLQIAAIGMTAGFLLAYLYFRTMGKSREGSPQSKGQNSAGEIFSAKHKLVKEVMIGRGAIKGVDIATSVDKIFDLLIEHGHSRIPVYSHDLDNLVGVLYAKDFLTVAKHKDLIILQDVIRPLFYVGEGKDAAELLAEFKKGNVHLGVVLDETGATSGLVTLEDLLAAVIEDPNAANEGK